MQIFSLKTFDINRYLFILTEMQKDHTKPVNTDSFLFTKIKLYLALLPNILCIEH